MTIAAHHQVYFHTYFFHLHKISPSLILLLAHYPSIFDHKIANFISALRFRIFLWLPFQSGPESGSWGILLCKFAREFSALWQEQRVSNVFNLLVALSPGLASKCFFDIPRFAAGPSSASSVGHRISFSHSPFILPSFISLIQFVYFTFCPSQILRICHALSALFSHILRSQIFTLLSSRSGSRRLKTLRALHSCSRFWEVLISALSFDKE